MGRPLIDMIGRACGLLTVIARSGSNSTGHPLWLCRCACGNTTVANGADLRAETYKSCGCAKTKHGCASHPLYGTWKGMMDRCYKAGATGYGNYGARGIFVCEKWHDANGFIEDMWASYSPELLLDRIDNDGPYTKENCRWSTTLQQARNKRTNKNMTLGGITKCLSDWAIELGLPKSTIQNRLRRGWSVVQTLDPQRR